MWVQIPQKCACDLFSFSKCLCYMLIDHDCDPIAFRDLLILLTHFKYRLFVSIINHRNHITATKQLVGPGIFCARMCTTCVTIKKKILQEKLILAKGGQKKLCTRIRNCARNRVRRCTCVHKRKRSLLFEEKRKNYVFFIPCFR